MYMWARHIYIHVYVGQTYILLYIHVYVGQTYIYTYIYTCICGPDIYIYIYGPYVHISGVCIYRVYVTNLNEQVSDHNLLVCSI